MCVLAHVGRGAHVCVRCHAIYSDWFNDNLSEYSISGTILLKMPFVDGLNNGVRKGLLQINHLVVIVLLYI